MGLEKGNTGTILNAKSQAVPCPLLLLKDGTYTIAYITRTCLPVKTATKSKLHLVYIECTETNMHPSNTSAKHLALCTHT